MTKEIEQAGQIETPPLTAVSIDPVAAAPVLTLSRHQLRLQKLQDRLRARMTGEEILQTEPKVVRFTSQLEKSTMDLLCKCKTEGQSRKEVYEEMVEPLKAALRHLSDLVVKIETPEPDRLRAATTIAWLAAQSLRAEIRLGNIEVKKANARKVALGHESRKAKHVAARAAVVLTVAAEQRKIDLKLRRSQAMLEASAEIATLKQAIADAPDRVSRLIAKQNLTKFKQGLRKKGK
jgi:hypothetical protein